MRAAYIGRLLGSQGSAKPTVLGDTQMRAFVSYLTAAILFVAVPALINRAEADLLRLKSGGKVRCLSISKDGDMVNCEGAAGNLSFQEAMVEEIIHDNDAGNAALSNPVAEAKTYGPGSQEELVEAVSKGDVDAVKKLLDEGADIDGSYKWEPVTIEIPAGVAPIVPVVKVSALSGTPSGVTPLMVAARTGNAALVRLLLERGANPNVRGKINDMGRSSALFEAVNFGAVDSGGEECVRLILASHPDNESLETAFAHIATSEYRIKTYIELFLEHGISERCREQALMQARNEGKENLFYLLQAAYLKHDKSIQRKE